MCSYQQYLWRCYVINPTPEEVDALINDLIAHSEKQLPEYAEAIGDAVAMIGAAKDSDDPVVLGQTAFAIGFEFGSRAALAGWDVNCYAEEEKAL